MSLYALRKARKTLGDQRLINFIHAAAEPNTQGRSITSLRNFSRELDNGRTLDDLFADNDEDLLTTTLKAEQLSARTFRITCGNGGRFVGDGGTWRVSFRACGKVQRLIPETKWIC